MRLLAAHDDDLMLSSHRFAELMLRFLGGEDVPPERIALSPLRFDH